MHFSGFPRPKSFCFWSYTQWQFLDRAGAQFPQFCSPLQTLQFRGYPWFFGKITQIPDFFAFPNVRRVGKFVASIERSKTKSASASGGGGFAPLIPDQGLGPRTPLYARTTAFAMRPCPFQVLGARNATGLSPSQKVHIYPRLSASVFGPWVGRQFAPRDFIFWLRLRRSK